MPNPRRIRLFRTLALGIVAASAASAAGCGPQISEQSQRLSDSMVALGRESFDGGDLGDALRKGLQAIEYDPQSADAHYFVGFVYATRGDYEEAERYLRKTIEIDSTYTDARNTLGQVYNNQGRYADAIVVLEEAARDLLYPTPHLVDANLGQAYMESGDYEQAIEWLLRAVREEARFCVAYYRLGDAFQRKGDDASAEEALAAAVAVDDPACRTLQPAWRLLGEVRLRRGETGPAAEAFAQCRDLDGESADGTACASAAAQIEGASSAP